MSLPIMPLEHSGHLSQLEHVETWQLVTLGLLNYLLGIF